MFNGAFRSFLFFGKREQIARIQHSSISLKPVPLFVNRKIPMPVSYYPFMKAVENCSAITKKNSSRNRKFPQKRLFRKTKKLDKRKVTGMEIIISISWEAPGTAIILINEKIKSSKNRMKNFRELIFLHHIAEPC